MSNQSAQHSTVVLARTYDAPVARVFAAIADPIERMRVYTVSEQLTVAFERIDLRVGGHEIFWFGLGDSLRFRGESIYHDVVPERRIVCTDIVWEGEVRLWVGATTLEFTPLGQRTQLKVTEQIIWLDGADTVEGCDVRYPILLENLEHFLSGNLRFRPRSVTSR